jgi:hypothetical protein
MIRNRFVFILNPVASSEAEAAQVEKTVQFPRISGFLQNPRSPTNRGTRTNLLPPVVGFKKILQKSYANVIPK